jgi:serine/threonine protein kinase
VAGSLTEAHALGLIHRDIKPANIVLTERADEPDVVKVVDFGLVRSLEHGHPESVMANVITGTPMYLAPEAISSPETIDGRADIYAVGAVAYRPASAAALRAALLACTDAATYDAAAASLWWRDRRTALADMARSDGISGSAPTMAVDLRGRHGASGIIAGPPGV